MSDVPLWMVASEVSAQRVESVVAAVGGAHGGVNVERFGLVVVEEDALVVIKADVDGHGIAPQPFGDAFCQQLLSSMTSTCKRTPPEARLRSVIVRG